jgi:hypothetical protein
MYSRAVMPAAAIVPQSRSIPLVTMPTHAPTKTSARSTRSADCARVRPGESLVIASTAHDSEAAGKELSDKRIGEGEREALALPGGSRDVVHAQSDRGGCSHFADEADVAGDLRAKLVNFFIFVDRSL